MLGLRTHKTVTREESFADALESIAWYNRNLNASATPGHAPVSVNFHLCISPCGTHVCRFSNATGDGLGNHSCIVTSHAKVRIYSHVTLPDDCHMVPAPSTQYKHLDI